MSIWLVVLAAWVVGSLVVLFASVAVLIFAEVLSSTVLLAVNITIGSSTLFTMVSIIVFVLFSSICYFAIALCAAMVGYGRISDTLRSDEDTHSVLSSVNDLLSDTTPVANSMKVVKVRRSGIQCVRGRDDPAGAATSNVPNSLRVLCRFRLACWCFAIATSIE